MSYVIRKFKYYGFSRFYQKIKKILGEEWYEAKHLKEDRGVRKSKVGLMLDMLWCTLRYGATGKDYSTFQFFNLSHIGRNRWVTSFRNDRLASVLNKGKTHNIFRDKAAFNTVFKEFIRRDWVIFTPPHSRFQHSDNQVLNIDELNGFINKHQEVIVKPVDAMYGRGVHKLKKGDKEGLEHLLEDVKKGASFLVEEVVENHPAIKAFHPASLNTLRIVTYIDKEDHLHYVTCLLRVGRGDSVIDNAAGGGLLCKVCPDNGMILAEAEDLAGRQYTRHPDTGLYFPGTVLPRWDEVLDCCERLSRHMPEARYVGWDIAVTGDGIDIIEGNIPPGADVLQAFSQGRWDEMKGYC